MVCMAVEIKSVMKNSPAYGKDIAAGDMLVSVNGHDISDVLDYMYYSAEINTELLLERCGERHIVNIKKSEYDDLGLEFETFLMDSKQSCCNKCIFCFIDQMPPNMRKTLRSQILAKRILTELSKCGLVSIFQCIPQIPSFGA